MKLTHFQKTVKRALDLSNDVAEQIQAGWPETEEALEDILFIWNEDSKSKVAGLRILSACPVIWGRKPSDHSKSQGRVVLYHPINGLPIEEGSALDGIPWEMLAFLRWATQEGHLGWVDEVTIAREVKGVHDFPLLPGDRFYAKDLIPRGENFQVDWSNVALARAKEFVLTGGPGPVDSIASRDLDQSDLVGVLSSFVALRDADNRNSILKGIPSGSIRRNSAPGADLYNIVEAAKGYGRLADGRIAINVVIDNAMRLVRGFPEAEAKLRSFKV